MPSSSLKGLDAATAEALIGIDTLWGGDVMNPSGTGRFIADCWFSDEPLPAAYTHPAAAKLRETGGVGAKAPDRASVEAYVAAVDVKGAIARVIEGGRKAGGLRGAYLEGLGLCSEVMWDLGMEILGRGPEVPYDRCVRTITGTAPEPSKPEEKRRQVADLLKAAGYASSGSESLLAAVDAWRHERLVPGKSIPALGDAFIAHYDALAAKNLLPFLPKELARVPRANVKFLAIENAWFSGSMNYLGHARRADGSPEYEATYELNASLQISVPEFQQLVSHEVVPGHVTTFAYLQDLFVRGLAGFEASVLTMNTRAAVLFEGIANNGVLVAHGVTEVEDLPDADLRIGVLLALLQDDAKNHSSYLTWREKLPQAEVAATLRNEFLVSRERADKLSGAWGRHPLLGRMYLPAYRAGTDLVAKLRREHAPEKVLPALYGAKGLVDASTLPRMLEGKAA
ncbi:MAG TPA: hypothetical protein VMV60_15200 [Thermoanaerobaculia bacterium]|nr:hypothetical protein [Thermoanaerobaculia bacterium]